MGRQDRLVCVFLPPWPVDYSQGGILSFITPHTYFTLTSHAGLREELLKYAELKMTYSGCCFSDANVDTIISQVTNTEQQTGTVSFYRSLKSSSCYECDKQVFQRNILNRFFTPDEQNMKLYNGILARLTGLYGRVKNTLTRDPSIASDVRRETIESYSKTLTAGSLTFLGLISDGDQGLVTGNNSKYLGVIRTSDGRTDEIETRFVNLLNREANTTITLEEFRADKQRYYGKAEGLRWSVPATEVINWRKENVHELKTSDNSRWQGEAYYAQTGYGWVDYFTNRLKGFSVGVGPYSKNVIKMHSFCPLVSDKFILALLNSDFIANYIKNMITITHTLQINDGRLIPVVIPTRQVHQEVVKLVDRIIAGNDEAECMEHINAIVWRLYAPLMAL